MFGWFKKKETKPLQPEASWTVEILANSIRVTDHTRSEKEIVFDRLGGVIIETNDSGPWSADVWWLLFDDTDQLACAFPQGATGGKVVVDKLMSLPGFDYQEMIKAMTSTENAVFPVYRRLQ